MISAWHTQASRQPPNCNHQELPWPTTLCRGHGPRFGPDGGGHALYYQDDLQPELPQSVLEACSLAGSYLRLPLSLSHSGKSSNTCSLVIPLRGTGKEQRRARSRLGAYYARRPGGGCTLDAQDETRGATPVDLKVGSVQRGCFTGRHHFMGRQAQHLLTGRCLWLVGLRRGDQMALSGSWQELGFRSTCSLSLRLPAMW